VTTKYSSDSFFSVPYLFLKASYYLIISAFFSLFGINPFLYIKLKNYLGISSRVSLANK
jgi:hypothetical protein